MLQNNTINKFQHFPFHLVDPSPKFIYTTGWVKPTAVLSSSSSYTYNSSRVNLDSLTPSLREPTDNIIPTNERLSNLALIKYKKDPLVEKEDLNDLGFLSNEGSSSYEESFPWLVDGNVKITVAAAFAAAIHKDIRLFDGVHLVSRFLELRLKMDKDQISEVKLTELLEQFQGKKEITSLAGELYDHVANLYNKDQDSFKSKVVEKLI